MAYRSRCVLNIIVYLYISILTQHILVLIQYAVQVLKFFFSSYTFVLILFFLKDLNGVPIPMYFATHFYFCFYHTLSNMALRKVVLYSLFLPHALTFVFTTRLNFFVHHTLSNIAPRFFFPLFFSFVFPDTSLYLIYY